VEQKLKGMANWKAPGLDEGRAFWIKNFTKLQGSIAKQLQQCNFCGDFVILAVNMVTTYQ